MPSAIHHHQVLHAASQVAAAGHSAWLDALPPWAQTPFFLTFAPCFVVLVLLMIRHRVNLHRRAERFTKSKTKPAEMVIGLLFFVALKYSSDRVPVVAAFVDWPYRHIPFLRDHPLETMLGFFAAGMAARLVSALYAGLFLRGSGSRGGGGIGVGMVTGRHTLLPTAPPGHDWYSSPQTTRRITGQRIYRIEEE